MIVSVKSLAALLAFGTAIFAAQLFTPAEFGKLSLLWAISAVLMVLLDFGATISYRKYGSDVASAPYRVGRILVAYLSRTFLLLVLAVGILATGWVASDQIFFALAIPLSLAFALETTTGEVLRARRLYFLSEIFSGGYRQIIYLCALLVALVADLSLGHFTLILSVSMAVFATGLLVLIGRPVIQWSKAALAGWEERSARDEHARFFTTQIVILMAQQYPLLAAGLFASDQVAAVVRVSLLFGTLMLFAAAGNAMYFAPRLAAARNEDSAEVVRLLRRSFYIGLIFIPAGMVLCLVLPLLIPALFGEHYTASVAGAQILVLAQLLSASFGAYGQMLLLRGFDRVNRGGAIVVLTGQAIALVPLVRVLGTNGYATAYAFGVLASLCYLALFGRRASGFWPGAFFQAR